MIRSSFIPTALAVALSLASGGSAAGGETGASTRPDRRTYKSYDYAEAGKKVRLTIPDGLAVVRGVLVVGPFSGGDTRDFHKEVWNREFMHLHGFAFLGAESFNSRPENGH